MNNRKPFDLKGPMIVYNGFQVILSAFICKEMVVRAYLLNYKLSCAEITDRTDKNVERV